MRGQKKSAKQLTSRFESRLLWFFSWKDISFKRFRAHHLVVLNQREITALDLLWQGRSASRGSRSTMGMAPLGLIGWSRLPVLRVLGRINQYCYDRHRSGCWQGKYFTKKALGISSAHWKKTYSWIHDQVLLHIFCRLIARRRELEDAQKQFHALASRISGEEQSLDGRGCSGGSFGGSCELSSFANIQAKQISQKLSLRLTRRKAWEMLVQQFFAQTSARSEVGEWWVVLAPLTSPSLAFSGVSGVSGSRSFFSFENSENRHRDIH